MSKMYVWILINSVSRAFPSVFLAKRDSGTLKIGSTLGHRVSDVSGVGHLPQISLCLLLGRGGCEGFSYYLY